MDDILFPANWESVDIDCYVRDQRADFDRLDIQTLPNYVLMNRLSVSGMVLVLLSNDPLYSGCPKRQRLNEVIQHEIRRQARVLVKEYNRRVQNKMMLVDNQPKSFLERYMPVEEDTISKELSLAVSKIFG